MIDRTLHLTRRRVLQAAPAAALLPAAVLPTAVWADQPLLTFLAVGDWGRDGGFHQRETADQMGELAARTKARFVISVGDNFYEDGVKGLDDPMWKTSFEDVYTAPSLQVPWYVALGNHDYHGDAQAQVDYSTRSKRWRMPARWFSFKEQAPDGASVEVFVLDTSPFIKSYYADGGRKVKVVGQDTDAQLAWFDRALSASNADWKLVVGHHPVYSGGKPKALEAPKTDAPKAEEKSESTPGGSVELMARLDPILQRNRVPLYLNGHDHDLQHVARGATHYVCTGAGSKTRNHCDMDGSDFCSMQSGFVACAVGRERLHLAYRDFTGAELHVVDIARPA